MAIVNQINRSNSGLSLSVPSLNLRMARRHYWPRLVRMFQTVINLVAPTGYEDAAGFHSGEAPRSARRPVR